MKDFFVLLIHWILLVLLIILIILILLIFLILLVLLVDGVESFNLSDVVDDKSHSMTRSKLTQFKFLDLNYFKEPQ